MFTLFYSCFDGELRATIDLQVLVANLLELHYICLTCNRWFVVISILESYFLSLNSLQGCLIIFYYVHCGELNFAIDLQVLMDNLVFVKGKACYIFNLAMSGLM